MNINKINIDWLDVIVDISHDPKKLSKGLKIYLDEDHNFDKAKTSYRSKDIESKNKHILKVKSVNEKLRISGNFYKWLHGQNITGCANIEDLVLDVVKKFVEMGLVEPTDEQFDVLKKCDYRIYQLHIKQDITFDNKKLALNYLDHLKTGGYYPYKPKTIYQNISNIVRDAVFKYAVWYAIKAYAAA